ncbi:hypothetical protein HYFRA_00008167 [Hymenoscyphus fraxineus]|uniref:Uncharacterized protein n=1 Tax=Hymenoscyphus fraxineus TaxID=746836 RepID=A0A9N9L9I7_9HELO|nr:hypothetical protein HYFRA_00008167 [Hymenoscyphus fraxineus]
MCKFLMSQGVSLAEDSQICNGPFKYLIGASIDYLASAASENYVAQGKDPTGDLESLANMVIPKCEVSLNTLKHFSGPSWLFSLLLKNIDPLLMEEAAFRTSIARHLSWRPCLVTPEIIRLALGEKVLKNPTTGSPLHYVAHAVGFTFAYVALGSPLKNGYLSPADCLSDWFSIAQDLVIHGIGLNGLDLYQETPLQQLFWGIYIGFLSVTIDPTESMPDNPRKIEMSQLTVLLRNYWLTPLKSFGVDLAKYGEEEKRTPGSGNWKALFNRWTFRIGFVLIPSFMGYQFGPEPDDWVLYWNEPTDRFAGEFWKMIEQGKGDEVMPGTWVD